MATPTAGAGLHSFAAGFGFRHSDFGFGRRTVMAGGPIVTVVKGSGRGSAVSRGTTEPRPVRWILTAVAVLFLVVFIVLPAANVFAQAMKHGWRAYVSVMRPSVD